MKRSAWVFMGLALAVLAGWLMMRGKPATHQPAGVFTVQRGELVDLLREVGELAPQDPLLLQAPFSSEIKWLVPDGSWVLKGERVIVFDEAALEQAVLEQRAAVIDKRQELQIKKLQVEHGRIAEQERVINAKQDLELAEIRHRILTTQPVGGNHLIALDENIKPIEARLEVLQAEMEPLEEKFRRSRDAYQKALQHWQEGRSRLLELRMGADLKSLQHTPAPKKKASTPPQTNTADAVTHSVELATTNVEQLKQALDAARTVRDQDRAPYEEKLADIDAIDQEAQELYVQIEIEKRGLPAAQLEIDRDIAKLRLAESRRQADNGQRAFDTGAMSQARLDQLVADAEAAAGRLDILEYRLEIASRPATEDQLAASEAILAAARRAAENAQEIYEREIKILESEQEVVEAELAEAIGVMERNGKGFPAAIEANISMLKAELGWLENSDTARQAEIQTELRQLESALEQARKNPPHILIAPSDGLVRLRRQSRHEERLTDIGDRWEKGHTVAMLYPPGNMSVSVGINEANYQRVREGMPCRVKVPALDLEIPDASVAHVSRIGQDRQESVGIFVSSGKSGIIEFALRVKLPREMPEFRQGMTVLLEIETDRRKDTLFLPAAAVSEDAKGRFFVQKETQAASPTEIRGKFFGDDSFMISAGLEEGDRVHRPR